jgi:hypothetical protein
MLLNEYAPPGSKRSRKESGASNGHGHEENGFNRDITCPHGEFFQRSKETSPPRGLCEDEIIFCGLVCNLGVDGETSIP